MKPEMKYKLLSFLASISCLSILVGILILIGVPFSKPGMIGVVIGTVCGSFAKSMVYKSRDKYISVIAVIALISVLLFINKNNAELVSSLLWLTPLLFLIIFVTDYVNKELYFRYVQNIGNPNHKDI